MVKKQFRWIWYAIWGLVCLVGGGGTLFSWMPRTPAMFYGGCAMLVLSVVLGVWLLLLAKGKPFQKAWLPSVIAGAAYAAVVAAIVYVCDEIVFKGCIAEYQPVHSSLAVVILNIVLTLALIIALPKKCDPKLIWLKRGVALILTCVALVLSGLPQNWWWGRYNFEVSTMKRVESPTGFSNWTKTEFGLVEDADFYVAVDGSDHNDGSFAHPFATIERARDAVRAMDKTGKNGITVAIKAGEYRVTSITFTAEDSGTEACPITYCAYGDGEVIFNAGVSLSPADFEKVSGGQADRLQDGARNHVYCVDLGKYGITAEQYGKLYALGSFNSASQYDGDWVGPQYCELFVNNTRQTIARYPNTGYLKTGAVLDPGQPRSYMGQDTQWTDGWYEMRNPLPTTYVLDEALAERMKDWELREDIWMFGYWYYDWADSSTPLGKVDFEKMTMAPRFVHGYGAKVDAPYYFYNVFEELDTQGEWYLDRDNGILYIYEPENMAQASITLSLSLDTMLVGENVEHLTFRGFTFQGTRGDAISVTGNRNTVEYCLVKNIGGSAITMDGYENLAANNEITRTGKSGIILKGGVQETLTPGNNRAYNNLVHDWSELWKTYQPAVYLVGVGNICDHNEIYNSPHEAIEYEGNNHVIEYNVIHDVCLETDDGGAIYSKRRWDWYGNIIRYNAIYDLGTPGIYAPAGIYMDDGLSGQIIYGNLLANSPDYGIKLGGGRDFICENNIVINTKGSSIGYLSGLYAANSDNIEGILSALDQAPWQGELWQQTYPALKNLYWDESRTDDANFWGNAGGSSVKGNIVVSDNGLGEISGNAARYSDISGNAVYALDMLKKIFVDPDNGDYRLREDSVIYDLIPDFEQLPIEKMGRE